MAVDQATQEVMRAALDVRTGTTPEQRRAQEIRQKRDEGAGLKAVAEVLQEQHTGIVEQSRIDTVVESIGTKRGPDGKKLRTDPDEASRHRTLKTNTEAIQIYLREQEFYKMNTAKQTEVLTALDTLITTTPELRAAFAGMSPTERTAMLRAFMNNRKFANRVQQVFSQRLEIGELSSDLVTQAEHAYEDAKRAYEQKKAEADTIEKRSGQLAQIESQLKLFQEPTTRVPLGGTEYQAMKTARDNLAALGPGVEETRKDRVARVKQRITFLEQQRADAQRRNDMAAVGRCDSDISVAQGDLSTANTELAEVNGYKHTIAEYDRRKKELESKKGELEQSATSLREEEARLQREMLAKKAHWEQEKLKRASQEQDLVDQLDPKAVFSSALIEYLNAEAGTLEAAQKAVDEERVAKATSEQQKKIEHDIETRWDTIRKGRWFGKERNTPDNGKINADYINLMQRGPEAYLRGLGVTDAALLNNVEFRSAMIQKLLQKKLQTGGIQQGEARRIFESTWGSGLLEAAKAHNKAFNDWLEEARSEGLIKGSWKEGLDKFLDSHPWLYRLLLSLIVGGTAAAVAGAIPVSALGLLGGIRPPAGSILETIGNTAGSGISGAARNIGSRIPR